MTKRSVARGCRSRKHIGGHMARPLTLALVLLSLAAQPSARGTVEARFGEVKQIGNGPVPMILMPCLGCDWRAFDQFMIRHAAKYRMYAVTWPGMGRTALPRVPAASGETPLVNNVIAALVKLVRD